MRSEVRIMTLMDLSQLPHFINSGHGGKLVTHVCVDSRSARAVLKPA
jgi:hypothetical protein